MGLQPPGYALVHPTTQPKPDSSDALISLMPPRHTLTTTTPKIRISYTKGCTIMIDTDLIVKALRERGYTVDNVIPVPENAGEFEFSVDGVLLSLDETRHLLEQDTP